jgi:hypothetical protein
MSKSTVLVQVATLASAFSLTACIGTSQCPSPDANPSSKTEHAPFTKIIGQDTVQSAETQTGTHTEMQVVTGDSASQLLDQFKISTPDQFSITTPDQTPTVLVQTRVDTVLMMLPPCDKTHFSHCTLETTMDPYKAFPALANYVFSYADTLSRAGQTDSASVILNSFSTMAPMWEKWQAHSDTLREAFGKRREEKAKEFESMALQIQNMNRVQASYSMVAETADSLISQLAPGDSLANWAKGQKKIAYSNTLKKASKEFDEIKILADEKAQFAEARKQTETFRIRYRDFEDTLQVQAFLNHIEELEKATNSETAKMWEKQDPAAALAKADTLIANEKFDKAKDLLNKLKTSKLRKEANEKYIALADAYCNKQRKTTSQIFAKSLKQTDEEKKKKLLNDAIAPLDKCLAEFPETTQREKVESNRKFIEKELAK